MMTDNEKKKDYLWGYRTAVGQMKRSEQKIREMRMNKMMPSRILDGMPHAHGHSDLSAYAALLDQEERRYLKSRYLRLKKCKEITDRIERMKDEDEKDILMCRYIRLMKWEDICEELSVSWRQAHYLHNKALEHFKIPA